MRVLITGGTGIVGKATTQLLIQQGWDVRVIGIEAGVEIDGAQYVQCDILDYDALLGQARGCDAIVHLAAVRHPGLAPGHDIFQINAAGTFNAFEAAAAAGIGRVVQASSINAVGSFYGVTEREPDYLPLDEAHPGFTTDPYSFSKQVIEDIGDYYWRRDGISSVALRFPGVYAGGFATSEGFVQRRAAMRAMLDELASLPEAELQARMGAIRQRAHEHRRTRFMEYRPDGVNARPNPQDDPLFWAYTFDRYNFWAMVDERDSAQSLVKSVTAAFEGAHALFVNDHTNSLDYDSRTLARLFFPDVPIKGNLVGSASLVSIERARALIGFEPAYSVATLEQNP